MARVAHSSLLIAFDLELCGSMGMVAGADEAGRGCLAGPLAAAAVVFDYRRLDSAAIGGLAGLKDSKKLTPAAREALYPLILRHASRVALVLASPRTIDEKGLHVTNLKALGDSLSAVAPLPEIILVDGYALPDGPDGHAPLKKGDSLSAAVAAASIVAKVARDRVMKKVHQDLPQYGFDRHMGYATAEHIDAIRENGYSAFHRRSFRINSLTP